jgi:uncharacterized metal-binding protein
MRRSDLPLVYSCSGCSSAAQMANYLALQLDRRGIAEMSCIAGVGGDVPGLLKTAHSGRPIVALDGCHLKCTYSCLSRHGLSPAEHVVLSEYGVRKHKQQDFDRSEADALFAGLAARARALTKPPKEPD